MCCSVIEYKFSDSKQILAQDNSVGSEDSRESSSQFFPKIDSKLLNSRKTEIQLKPKVYIFQLSHNGL